jgi:hypothetical protein
MGRMGPVLLQRNQRLQGIVLDRDVFYEIRDAHIVRGYAFTDAVALSGSDQGNGRAFGFCAVGRIMEITEEGVCRDLALDLSRFGNTSIGAVCQLTRELRFVEANFEGYRVVIDDPNVFI